MNTTTQIVGLVAYLILLLTILRPMWVRYLRRTRGRARQQSVLRRERIDELTAMHNRREAIRIGWQSKTGGGWL